MKIFVPELVVGDREGFTPANDMFGRRPIADGLSHLVANIKDPLVIALDAQWGSGKTVFLKQWAGELRKAGFPVIFFDAFAHDFAEDAFAAIAGQVIALIEEHNADEIPAAKKFAQKAWSVGKILTRSALRVGVKIATLSAVDTKDLEETAKLVGDELSKLEDENLGHMLTRQREQKDLFNSFGDALTELPAALHAHGELRPLIFIIDDLDRCRPQFALEVLERIKHFFSVPNVHFVLGVHLAQLENSVEAAYGSKIDSRLYLQKFIQLSLTLEDPAEHRHERVTSKYISHLLKRLQIPNVTGIGALLSHVSEARQLSLRSIERIMTAMVLVVAFKPDHVLAPIPLIEGLAILKVLEPDKYRRAQRRQLKWDDIRTALAFHVKPDPDAEKKVECAQKWWSAACGADLSKEPQQSIGRALDQHNIADPRDLLAWIANELMERLQPTTP